MLRARRPQPPSAHLVSPTPLLPLPPRRYSSLLPYFLIGTCFLVTTITIVVLGTVRVDAFVRRYVWVPIWEASATEQKLSSAKFQFDGLPVVIVNSMERSVERRKHLFDQLEKERFNMSAVEVFQGFDAIEDGIQWEELVPYFGSSRLRKGGFHIPACRLPRTNRSNICDDVSLFERAKVACDVSYLRVLYRLAADVHIDFALVLEDDVLLAEDFLSQLGNLMNDLPQDWDLLMLYAFRPEIGAKLSQKLAVLKSSAGTVAFLIRRKAVFRVLEFAPWALPHMYIDNLIMGNLPETGRINAYIAQPLLCWHSKSFKSNIDF